MKTLFLLRHAEALSDQGSGDFARKLSAGGMEAARALGHAMKAKNYIPTFVMCSSAVRTQATLEALTESISPGKIERDKKIYHATPMELLEIIRGFDDAYASALVLGHNPAIHQLAAELANEDSALFEKLAAGYPPGTLSVFECPRTRWADIQAGENNLKDLI